MNSKTTIVLSLCITCLLSAICGYLFGTAASHRTGRAGNWSSKKAYPSPYEELTSLNQSLKSEGCLQYRQMLEARKDAIVSELLTDGILTNTFVTALHQVDPKGTAFKSLAIAVKSRLNSKTLHPGAGATLNIHRHSDDCVDAQVNIIDIPDRMADWNTMLAGYRISFRQD